MLLTCQAGFESLFARELAELHHTPVSERGPGWVLAGNVAKSSSAPLSTS